MIRLQLMRPHDECVEPESAKHSHGLGNVPDRKDVVQRGGFVASQRAGSARTAERKLVRALKASLPRPQVCPFRHTVKLRERDL